MKIAFVTNTCWNVYNFREGLVKFFLERGDKVISLAPRDKYSAELEKWGVKHIDTPLDQTGSNPVKDLNYCNHVRKIFKKEAPDIALSFTIKPNIYSSLAGKISGVHTICNVSGLGTVFLASGWSGKFALKLYRLAFKYSAHIFFQNKDDQKHFLRHVRLNHKRIGLLPGSGINLKKFNYQNLKISNPTKLLMIGRIIEEKGVRDFVEASRILKEKGVIVDFTLVGKLDENHSRSISKEEVEEWERSELINYLPHNDNIQDLIAEHEVVVLPSYREGTPRTLLEGAALGRPLLAANVPGCKEVVKDGFNGFLFEVKNPASLVDKLRLYLALSEEERKSFSANSRKLVEENFDEKLVIQSYIETIAQIVDK